MDNVTQEQNQDTNAEEILSNGGTVVFQDNVLWKFPLIEGVYEIRFEEGKILVTYKESVKEGEMLVYDSKGTLLQRLFYKNDFLNGQTINYFSDGKTPEVITTFKENILEGPMTSYYSNGVKRSEALYKKGKLEGDFLFYDEFGDLSQKTVYRNGLKDGISKAYFPKSQGGGVCQVSQYEKDLLKGNQDLFYPTGELLQRTPYDQGKALNYPTALTKEGTPLADPANKNRVK